MKLHLSKIEKKDDESYDTESSIHQEVTINITLPDEREVQMKFTTGDTVQNIKKRLVAEHDLVYGDIECFYNDTLMIDPLSLNDFPDLDLDDFNLCVKAVNAN
eukprot:CAMPEP_0174260050 /NCGR_PEP_ID=MMETSP0439-20130205/8796_1 /TAXON_ID=0 /ORGANISM="Stereomyxa ramosa, Strain Chinc5" /LENGTH=102 /DNA_ID=CAMNT_0015344181 /DNA_START=42 /DNA_END=350 /DNA_ORIENTATION=-